VKDCADKKLRRIYGAFVPVVEALKDYSGVIDTMSKSRFARPWWTATKFCDIVQAYPMPLALIWGGLKIVLDVSILHH
jgi:hypothetical protein